MKIYRFHEFGPLDGMTLDEIDMPRPAPGEALVKLRYAALNPADYFVVQGQYPRSGPPPMAVGRDGCGTIEQPAADGRFKHGDKVVLLRSAVGVTRNGTLAEYVTVPEESLAPLPEGWSDQEGAAGPLTLLTAWLCLNAGDRPLTEGQTVLVNGASGGVGTSAVMLAAAAGARVIALSRSLDKRARLRELGATVTVDSDADDLVGAVREASGDARADIVVENLGGPYLQPSIDLAAPRGTIAVVGLLAGLKSEIQIAKLIHKEVRIKGVMIGNVSPSDVRRAWDAIVPLLNKSGRRPIVDSVYLLERTLDAFARLKSGVMGKVLIGPLNDTPA